VIVTKCLKVQESQESHNQQMISESESEEEFDPEEEECQEEENTEEDQQSTTTPSEVQATITKSVHVSRIPVRYQHLQATTENTEEYTMDNARVLAYTIWHTNYTFIQTYSLKAGIKKFGEQGRKAALDEMKQIHDRVVFRPIRINNMSETERKHAMESLMFLVQKKCGRIKARTCANGSTQRQYITKDEATSPTVSHEAIIITGVIKSKQQRDIMTADIPDAFVQTDIDQSGEKIIMKIKGNYGYSGRCESRDIQQLCCPRKRSKCPLCSNVKSTLWHDGVIITILQEVPKGYRKYWI